MQHNADYMFLNRTHAGRQLAARLEKYSGEQGVVLAVPRGGVTVAYEVAKVLGWPMDLLLTKKLGHPLHKEYAIGAVSLFDVEVLPHADVTNQYIESETATVRARLLEMRQKFLGDKPPLELKGKTAIIVDDGIATGHTMLASVMLLRRQEPAKIIVAVPVAPPDVVGKLGDKVDELVVLDTPRGFKGVGQFYEDFRQVTDEEVIADLRAIEKDQEP